MGSYKLSGMLSSLLHSLTLLTLLIFQVDPDTRPATLAPPFTDHFRVILDTPRGLQSLHPGIRPSEKDRAAPPGMSAPKPTPGVSATLELRSNIYQTTSKSSREITSDEANLLANSTEMKRTALDYSMFSCDTCGVDCTPVRYHFLKSKNLAQKNFALCPPCYLDGRFPSTMFSGDFVKLTTAPSASAHSGGGSDWSDQEVLLLLEGVEMYDDDWSLIEEHVGTRSAQQCIRKFLELPIEDPYLEAESEGAKGPLRYARLPFEQADNPVMSVVAFLAGVVGPGIAAEAAKTAMKELTNGKTETGETEENGGEHKDAEKSDEVMGSSELEKGKDDARENQAEAATSKDDTQPGQPEEAMNVDSSPTTSSTKKPTPTIPHSKVARAAHLALSASARTARKLADAEETTIRSAISELVKLTLTKLELKMAQFEELEELLEEERRSLEAQRMALAAERVGLRKAVEAVKAEVAKNSASGTGTGTGTPAMMMGMTNGGSAAVGAAATVLGAGQGTKVSEVADRILAGEAGPSTDGNFALLG